MPRRALDPTAHLEALALSIEHGFTLLHGELVRSRDAVKMSGAEYRAITATPGGPGVRVMTAAGRVAGFSVREVAGAAAVVKIHDGYDAGGPLVLTLALPANSSSTQWFLPGGVAVVAGVFVEVAAGAVEGVLYFTQT